MGTRLGEMAGDEMVSWLVAKLPGWPSVLNLNNLKLNKKVGREKHFYTRKIDVSFNF